MSSKYVLLARPYTTPQIIREAVAVFPILWIAMLSEENVTACEDMRLITTLRREATERCADAIPFISALFPEFDSIEPIGERFHDLLMGFRCQHVGIDISEEMQTNPDICLLKIYVAVQAVRHRQQNATFACPSRYVQHPRTGELVQTKPRRYVTTREVLSYVASIDLSINEDEYHLIGTPVVKAGRAKWSRSTRGRGL
jgi:hypothetical protein